MPTRPRNAKPMGKAQPDKRPTAHQRGYTEQHRFRRMRLLAARPFCEMCKVAWSVHLHHLRYGNDLTDADFQCLCVACHNKIHKGSTTT